MKDDSNDTKNETEKRILSFFLIGQSFLKIFAGAGAKLAGRRLALKELKYSLYLIIFDKIFEFQEFEMHFL